MRWCSAASRPRPDSTAHAVSSLVGAQTPGQDASYLGLAVTVLVPIGLVAAYVVLRRVTSRPGGGRRPPELVLLLTVLLGLSSGNVFQLLQEELTDDSTSLHKTPPLFAKGGVAAAEYVKDHSRAGAVVATNMHCADPDELRCDNRHFWLSAYAERRVVIEGWGYTAPTNALAQPDGANAWLPVPFPERLATNDAAFREPSEATVSTLVDTYDVKWLVVSKAYEADVDGLRALDDLLKKAFENSNYVAFKVR